jgi:hypothetical protein
VALSTAADRPDRASSLALLDPLGTSLLQLLRIPLWGVPVVSAPSPTPGSPLARSTAA